MIYGGVFLVLSPFLIFQYGPWGIVACLVGGLLSHGVLALFRQTRASMEQSIRAVSYANAVYFWAWVPVVGLFVQWFWVPWVEAVGLRNRTDFREALAAVLVSRHEHLALFEQAFDLFWRNPRLLEKMVAAMLPRIRLHSPKITRKLTTEWFAKRVNQRYQRCMRRAK